MLRRSEGSSLLLTRPVASLVSPYIPATVSVWRLGYNSFVHEAREGALSGVEGDATLWDGEG